MIEIDAAEALAHLRAGRIDAIVYVAGHPVKLLRDAVKPDDGFVLLSITVPRDPRRRVRSDRDPAGTYPWQPNAVPTVAVTAVVVAHDPDRRYCDTIRQFARHVVAGLDGLATNGHPYWRRVDIRRSVKGWQPYDCAHDDLRPVQSARS